MTVQKTIFTEQECSDRTGLSRATLWRLRSAGKISHYKVGTRILYDEKHIEEFWQRQERRARTSRKSNSSGDGVTEFNSKCQPVFARVEVSQ
jgi:excisionase family DNA binding protein